MLNLQKVSKSSIKTLIDSISLTDHLKQFETLKRSGAGYLCVCPFHDDSKPSMYVYPDHFHCFSCGAHGDVITYEMKRLNISFPEAIKALSEKYNIALDYDKSTSSNQGQYDKNSDYEYFQNAIEELLKYSVRLGEYKAPKLYKVESIEKVFSLPYFKKDKYKDQKRLFNFDLSILKDAIFFVGRNDSGRYQSLNILKKDYYDKIELTPFKTISQSKFFFPIADWDDAKKYISKSKVLFLTSHLGFYKRCQKFFIKSPLNLYFSKNFSSYDLKAIFHRFEKVVFIFTEEQKMRGIFENLILNSLSDSDFKISVKILSSDFKELLKIQDEKEDFFKKSSKQLLECFLDRLKNNLSPSSFFYYVKNTLVPILNNISNSLRKKILINDIAQKYFTSESEIFFDKSLETVYLSKQYPQEIKKTPRESDAQVRESQRQRDLEFLALETLKKFYHRNLKTHKNHKAYNYLLSRHYSKETIQKYKIGLCLNNEASKYFQDYKEYFNVLKDLGLIRSSTKIKGEFYDFFFKRIIVPICDHSGQTVAFGGRIFEESKKYPKYLNSSENPIFVKSQILFNYFYAQNAIKQEDSALIVEGYLDCLTLVQEGFLNTVAILGTALSSIHVRDLRNVTKNVVLCFDNDEPGRTATKRAFETLSQFSKMTIFICSFNDCKDPDEFLNKYGRNAFKECLLMKKRCDMEICAWIFSEDKKSLENLSIFEKEFCPLFRHMDDVRLIEILNKISTLYFEGLNPELLLKRFYEIKKTMHPQMLKNTLRAPHQEKVKSLSWKIQKRHELALVGSLMHVEFETIPSDLTSLINSEDDTADRVLVEALNACFSEQSMTLVLELLLFLKKNPGLKLVDLNRDKLKSLSFVLQSLWAIFNSDFSLLEKFNISEISTLNHLDKISPLDSCEVFDRHSYPYIGFLSKSIELSNKSGKINEFVREVLRKCKLNYIGSRLKELTNMHYNSSITDEIKNLISLKQDLKKKLY